MSTSFPPGSARAVPQRRRRSAAILAASALGVSLALGSIVPLAPAVADTKPPSASTAQTVSSDGLPTAQIGTGLAHEESDSINGGVVWDQAIIGNTVYVGGNFQRARQPGAGADAAVERQNFLAYDLTTGRLLDLAIPFNGEVRTIAASPDGKRLYLGGFFTTADGKKRNRIAAIDVASGTLVADFAPYFNASVKAIAVSNTRVFVAGAFSGAGGIEGQNRVASLRLDGTVDPAWNPKPRVDPKGVPKGTNNAGQPIEGSDAVQALIVSPDGSKVVIGGNFNSLNGSNPLDTNQPGYGMGMVRADNGASLPWKANKVIRNATSRSAITSLSSDGEYVYGTGMWSSIHKGGHFEGTFKASWVDGSLDWMEDCHGDTYSTYATADVVYKVSHAHACDTLGGFPEDTPDKGHKWYRALAFTKERTRTLTSTPNPNYFDFGGNPAPSMLDWYPDLRAGTFTGATQAAWDITGSGDYVVLGGEFLQVNGIAQQGLVRFAAPSVAPNQDGPVLSGSSMKPTITGIQNSYASLTWPANYDRDNRVLTYDVFRDGNTTTPVFSTTIGSNFYTRPIVRATDGYLTPGTTYSYRIRTTDPFGNSTWGDPVSYTVPTTGSTAVKGQRTGYDATVLADRPSTYWPLNEAAGETAYNWVTKNAVTAIKTRGAGAESGASQTARAYTPGGATWAATTAKEPTSRTFSTELWFKTTSKTGGTLVAQSPVRDLTSGFDRALYMDTSGRVLFTATDGTTKALSTNGAFNDGKWHHVAVTVGDAGTTIYMDGTARASRRDLRTGNMFGGSAFWAIGAHDLTGRHLAPKTAFFTGSLDNIAGYSRVLTSEEVAKHYAAGTAKNAAPTASFTSAAKTSTLTVDGSGSSDSDGGIRSYAWEFGDGTTATGATATHTYTASGSYPVRLTVTDLSGATGTTSTLVTIDADSLAADSFERTTSSSWGSTEPGGAWAIGSGASGFSTANGSGVISGTGTRTATLPSVSSTSTDSRVTFDIAALTAKPQYVSIIGRQVGADAYSARVVVQANGQMQLQLLRSGTALTIPASGKQVDRITLPGTYTPGQRLTLRLRAATTDAGTTLAAKSWPTASAEPSAWQLSTTDTTPALQSAGTVGLGLYSATASTVSFDDFRVRVAR